jgi:hypothetical protein
MIAASVQCDVDGIPKGSHCVRVSPTGYTNKLAKIDIARTGNSGSMSDTCPRLFALGLAGSFREERKVAPPHRCTHTSRDGILKRCV